ncbi:hypothetical protein [Candidatus Enterococcus clewellii]|uniref:Uncharacterized protein n=1 Tax=Candidatus Enterococcus clewellii TaxID=1834193 RepID=A0A242KDJ8_9ENTE|nr:hypothetical protein [Enterococcus sp. 9E7_DIV0242]OTP19036.1 hypothetical protein A5888_000850 [Enterococcus sp. 9E7_DIV0242]
MNYLWELVVKANQNQLTEAEINYCYPKRFSPYLEVNFEHLNGHDIDQEVEINPYYRFSKIFNQMFLPDDHDNQEVKRILFDLFFHYIARLDANQGMNKKEYQISFVQEDIRKGLFGHLVQKNYAHFSFLEQKHIAQNLLRLYQTNQGILIFKETIQYVYPKAIQFVHLNEKNELTIFLQIRKTALEEKKIAVLKELFLPFKFSLAIYYEHMIGILAVDAFMKIDELVLF